MSCHPNQLLFSAQVRYWLDSTHFSNVDSFDSDQLLSQLLKRLPLIADVVLVIATLSPQPQKLSFRVL